MLDAPLMAVLVKRLRNKLGPIVGAYYGGFNPIRANLGREIVVKTPFPRSFMQMIFPTLSGAFPIINV